jgi:uncharacterized Zn finger protein (UPF0148 family)
LDLDLLDVCGTRFHSAVKRLAIVFLKDDFGGFMTINHCGSCGTKVTAEQVFCPSCGQRLDKYVVPAQAEPFNQSVQPNEPKLPKAPRKKMSTKAKVFMFSAIGAVVALIITSGSISAADYANHIHTTDDVSVPYALSAYVPTSELDSVLQKNCKSIEDLYVSDADYNLLSKRLAYLQGIAAGDSRTARTRLAVNAWYSAWTPLDVSDNPIAYLYGGRLRGQIELLIAKNEKIDPSDVSGFYDYWATEIEKEAISVCKIKSKNADYISLSADYDSAKTAAQSNADSAPWYPVNYTEWSGDSNVAYRFVSGSCDYGTRCSHVRVITLSGCPTNLYVEANFENSYGTVVDWTNDTASYLGAGDSAYLTLSSYQDDADTTRLTKIDCY